MKSEFGHLNRALPPSQNIEKYYRRQQHIFVLNDVRNYKVALPLSNVGAAE
jgi:hypothetical protein